MMDNGALKYSYTKMLKDRFPILFDGLGVPWRQDGIGSLEVGLGWFGLLYDFGYQMEPVLEKMIKEERGKILQIKEKFAGLTIHFGGGNEKTFEIIKKVKQVSYKTCEWCGEKGTLSELSWLKTLCNKCHKKRIEDRKRGGLWT